VHPTAEPEKAFGDALRAVRKEKRISQEALALERGFDRTYVSLIERGVKSPTFRTRGIPLQATASSLAYARRKPAQNLSQTPNPPTNPNKINHIHK